MSSKRSLRRQFLKNGAALAGFVAGAISSPASKLFAGDTPSADLHAYGGRSRFENDVRICSLAMCLIVLGSRRDYRFRSLLLDSMVIINSVLLHFSISHSHEPSDL